MNRWVNKSLEFPRATVVVFFLSCFRFDLDCFDFIWSDLDSIIKRMFFSKAIYLQSCDIITSQIPL